MNNKRLCAVFVPLLVAVFAVAYLRVTKPVTEYKSYYDNGVLKKQYALHNGIRHGKQFEFYANGAIMREYYLNQGVLDGVWVEWSCSGCLMGFAVFDMGASDPKKIPIFVKDVTAFMEKTLAERNGHLNGYPLKYGRLDTAYLEKMLAKPVDKEKDMEIYRLSGEPPQVSVGK